MADMSNKHRGLYDKYKVERNDGKEIGACLVLEFKDPIARVGIKAWAEKMRSSGYEAVANDVERMLAQYDGVGVVSPLDEIVKKVESETIEPIKLMPLPTEDESKS